MSKLCVTYYSRSNHSFKSSDVKTFVSATPERELRGLCGKYGIVFAYEDETSNQKLKTFNTWPLSQIELLLLFQVIAM